MIEATLIFILGFLAAVFLAVLVAPAIWRRAVVLTRRRIEAALPLSMEEIRADKDALRARYAVETRRLEMTVAALREKIIAQSLENERLQSEMHAQKHALHEQDAARMQVLAERTQELERLGEMYDEASFTASNRQIELVAQEANIELMSEEISTLNKTVDSTEAKLREAESRIAELERALDEEKSRIRQLERSGGKAGKDQKSEADTVDGTALLRERISDLAAKMVSLTAQMEGPDSQIHGLLGDAAGTEATDGQHDASLAGRIRALQK